MSPTVANRFFSDDRRVMIELDIWSNSIMYDKCHAVSTTMMSLRILQIKQTAENLIVVPLSFILSLLYYLNLSLKAYSLVSPLWYWTCQSFFKDWYITLLRMYHLVSNLTSQIFGLVIVFNLCNFSLISWKYGKESLWFN